MIKFKTTGPDGEPGFGFGLSEENIRRLKMGKPIRINLSDLGMKGTVVILYGETEEKLCEELKPYIGKDTKVHGV